MAAPAWDAAPVWIHTDLLRPNLLVLDGRLAAVLGVDEGTWQRACGYALHQAAMIIPYYAATNPEFAEQARRTVAGVVGDF